MGSEALFCCFRNQKPNILASIGLGASIFSFIFLIWGISDIGFKRDGVKAIYIIAFIFVILCMLMFVALLLFTFKSDNRSMNNVGKILCLVILGMCAVALLFLFISFIILLVDYAKLNRDIKKMDDYDFGDDLDDYDWDDLEFKIKNKIKKYQASQDDIRDIIEDYLDDNYWLKHIDGNSKGRIHSHEWAAVIVPCLFSFISLVVMALVANVLYKVFQDKANSLPNRSSAIPTQSGVQIVPNNQKPGMFPNTNGPVPQMANNVAYPVNVQQNEINLNK